MSTQKSRGIILVTFPSTAAFLFATSFGKSLTYTTPIFLDSCHRHRTEIWDAEIIGVDSFLHTLNTIAPAHRPIEDLRRI